MNRTYLSLILLITQLFFSPGTTLGQEQLLVKDTSWHISNLDRSQCFIDTFSSSIWLYVDLDQALSRYGDDSTFLIVQAELVNRSIRDVYVEGSQDRLKAAVVKETVETVDDESKLASHLSAALYIKSSLAFESTDYVTNPFKDLWTAQDDHIYIPAGARKKLWVAMPKRSNICYLEFDYHFSENGQVLNCQGENISWQKSIKSNKFQVYRTGI